MRDPQDQEPLDSSLPLESELPLPGGALPAELRAWEQQLNRLSLPAARVDRDRLFFQAGLAAARQTPPAGAFGAPWFWPGACAGLTVVAATLAVMLFLPGNRAPESASAVRDVPASPNAPVARHPPSQLRPSLTRRDLQRGFDRTELVPLLRETEIGNQEIARLGEWSAPLTLLEESSEPANRDSILTSRSWRNAERIDVDSKDMPATATSGATL